MGYENENDEPCVLDIETLARADIEPLVEMPTVPSNWKDQEKIAAAKAEKLQATFERAALDLNLNCICVICVWTASMGLRTVVAKTEDEERHHLAALGLFLRNSGHPRRIVTFNGLSFDLLVALRRAQLLRIEGFPQLQVTPSWRSPHTDLMEVLTFGGKVSKRSLDFYCRLFGIEAEASDDIKAVTGADVARLADEGRWDLIEGHCRYDVERTMLLAKRLGVLS